ncbi:MAG: hypothetical protein ACRD4Q_07885 [Candidatus Acidiferrales bacterium]
MSILIEQEEEKVANAFEVNRNVVLRSIRLASATLTSTRLEEVDNVALQTQVSFEPTNVSSEAETLVLSVSFVFRIIEGENRAGAEIVRIDCQLEADYGVRPDCVLTDQQIAAFHSGNAIFNCWPFFREYVQNSTVRMNYPAPPIPLLRLIPKRKLVSKEMDKAEQGPTRKQRSKPKTKSRTSTHKID